MMTLRRFRTLADSYGADLQRWPESLRRQALELLDSSAEAQAVISRARELDEALAAAGAAREAHLWDRESADAALHRLRQNVSARIRRRLPEGADALGGSERRTANRSRPRHVGWFGFATAAGLAVLAGLALGIVYSPSPQPPDLTALLQPAPLQVLAD
jgi:anti-sigma-K factor RskA